MAEDTAEAAPQAVPTSRKVLVLGDETFLYTAGLQEAYPDVEFTACSALSTQNITSKEANPFPPVLKGRVKHMQNPLFVGKAYPSAAFDELIFILPGLSFMVPKELGTSDRPLYAYRLHHFVFHLLRSTKVLMKGESDLHIVWPEETSLMSSPCGAAGIELVPLLRFLGCKQQPEAKYSLDQLKTEGLNPIIFGMVQNELPEWLQGMQMLRFTVATGPIKVPLSVALQLHPDLELVGLREQSSVQGVEAPGETAPLKTQLLHEAVARKARLKDMYGPHEKGEMPSSFDLVREAPAPDPESLLSVPMEVFMISFDDVPHFAHCMRFQVLEDQPPLSHATIDVLDPRLPTRVARPAPVVAPPPVVPALPVIAVKKRSRPKDEEWGEMKFYCPLTKISTPTAEKMRLHMEGELYKKFVARDPNWDTSDDKKDLIFDLEEEEAKRAKKDKGKGDGKGKGKGGKSKGKSDGKSKDGKSKGGKSKGKGGGKSRY
mmetsp:Transcript_29088/g.68558  ORF Transcript_29088/g.68558 Transcript_29088/m.68558 type:complete len:488 (-) Transcript_29088:62-1525(-)